MAQMLKMLSLDFEGFGLEFEFAWLGLEEEKGRREL